MPKYDPTEEINRKALGQFGLGKLYDKYKQTHREAQTGLTKGVNWATTPFESLVEKGKEADTRRARQFDIPEDYELPKGGSEFVAENITPLDIALAAAPGIKRLAQMESVGEALKFSNPLRSEVGAVGKDISKAAKAVEPKISRKGGLLFDNDLAGATPRNIGTNPRAQGTAPRQMTSIEVEGGFTGKHSPKTGTFRLEGPQGEVVSGKIHPDHIEFISIGKGKAKNSKSAQDAIRALAAKEGKPVYSTSTNLSSSGGEFRSRMMERGDLVETDKGLLWKGTGETSPTPKAASTPPGKTTKPQQLPSNPPSQVSGGSPKAAGQSNLPPQQPPNTPSGNVPPSGTPPNPTGGPPTGSNKPKKASLIQNIFGIPKTLTTPGDLPSGRQLLIASATHPKKVGWPALKAGMKSQFGPERMYEEVLDDIISRPNLKTYEKYKLAIPEVGVQQEFPSDLPLQAEEALGVAGPITRSKRGYDATMKTGRANLFDLVHEKAAQKYGGVENIPEATTKGNVNFTHDFSGYGTLGPLEPIADKLAIPFFSPRFRASTIHKMNPWNYLGGQRWGDVGKSMARQDMAKFAGGTAGTLGAADYALGDKFDVEIDPRSPDVGSIKVGNTTFDTMGGLKPAINTAARFATGEAKSPKDDENIYPVDRGSVLGRYVRSSLGPGIPTMIGDALFGKGKNYVGEPINRSYQSGPFEDIPYLPWAVDQITPMYPSDVTEAFQQSGPEVGIPAALGGILGIGSTSYDRTPNWSPRKPKSVF